MAKTETILIWEKSLYCAVAGKGWMHFPLARLEDAAAIVQEHVKVGTKLTLIYDPDVLHTEQADCPSGGRMIVREAFSSTYEAVSHMHTAWGYQTPVPIPGSNGMNSTFCSYETVPSLLSLKKTLEEIHRPVQRAYPLLSLASQSGATPGRTAIFVVVDQELQAFVYLNTATGMRACRKLYGGKREDYYDVWAEISLVLGEYGVSLDDGGQRPAVRIYQAGGTDVKTQCPYWETLSQMAQVEVYNLAMLASLANNLPAHHCSSLLEDMPRTIRLDLGFQVASGLFAGAVIGVGIFAYIVLSGEGRELDALGGTARSLAANKLLLTRNKEEMEKLQTLYAQGIFEASKGRMSLLETLPGVIPRDATLEFVNAGVGNKYGFHLKGIFWNAGLDGSRSGGTTNAITPITQGLSEHIPGLLVDETSTFDQSTGDFRIHGSTPLPEGETNVSPPAGE